MRNVKEAENIGSLVSLTIFQFQFVKLQIREREGNEKKTFPKFGNGKGMKKSIPIIWEWELEAFILGNGREREFPLTPVLSGNSEIPLRVKDSVC